MTPPLEYYLWFAALLFVIGVAGVLLRRNVIIVFMSIELMLNAVNVTFIAFSRQMNNIDGQIFVFFVMTLAAAEVAVGLAIIVAMFRNKESINIEDMNLLKW
ncbi:MAG: NADH-quinone oxidoreductase subunit NuoK [Candidatus Marinimicrobia bacterium]|nr:NADH-quinone oxidoreductase subunit NuoK [Candidatus Neomarinimicrobiota bacterium]TFB10586.1 NADH-quinone oxidoreductase subunit NuoK [Candidatus Marinimicrobia bacterium MT.SAG.2]